MTQNPKNTELPQVLRDFQSGYDSMDHEKLGRLFTNETDVKLTDENVMRTMLHEDMAAFLEREFKKTRRLGLITKISYDESTLQTIQDKSTAGASISASIHATFQWLTGREGILNPGMDQRVCLQLFAKDETMEPETPEWRINKISFTPLEDGPPGTS